MAMKLRRTVATYEACHPEAVAEGSKASIAFFVADAQHDIAVLADANAQLVNMLRECRATFAFAAGDGDDPANDFIAEIDAVLARVGA